MLNVKPESHIMTVSFKPLLNCIDTLISVEYHRFHEINLTFILNVLKCSQIQWASGYLTPSERWIWWYLLCNRSTSWNGFDTANYNLSKGECVDFLSDKYSSPNPRSTFLP